MRLSTLLFCAPLLALISGGCRQTPPPAATTAPAPAASAEEGRMGRRSEPPPTAALPSKQDPAPAIPQFPWPPPEPSTRDANPPGCLPRVAPGVRLREVADRLASALDEKGYTDKAWFGVPQGFALVTRLEQIRADGSPKSGDARWAGEPRQEIFSLGDYFKALFLAPPGRFRVIVMIVTSAPLAPTGHPVKREEAMNWFARGLSDLPSQLAQVPLSEDHRCAALIYEFQKATSDTPASQLKPSPLPGRVHLKKSGLLGALAGVQ